MKEIVDRTITALPLLYIYYLAFFNKFLGYFIWTLIIFGCNLEILSLKKVTKKNNIMPLIIINLGFIFSLFINYKNLFLLIGLNIISDSSQLFSGKYLKNIIKFRPFPEISPNKTLIGYIGGIILTLVINYFFKFVSYQSALIILFAGILGDLIFSKIKRNNNIKDYFINLFNIKLSILKTHGGLLDRFDSIIVSIIFYKIYYLMLM
mgnify:CR=1 FL=1